MVPPSDDDTAQPGPRVPPPPTMSFMKELGGDAAPSDPPPTSGDDPVVGDAASSTAEPPTPAYLIDVLHADLDRAPAEAPPSAPAPRRGALPRPSRDAKRVSSRRDAGAATRPRPPSASGLPTGLRPPGAPAESEPEDTGALLRSAVEELTAGEPDPASEFDDVNAPKTERAARPAAGAAAAAPVDTAGDETRRRPLWMWAIPVAAILAGITWWAFSGSEPEPQPTPAVVAASPEPPPAGPEPAADPEPNDAEPEALAVPHDLGEPAAAALDVGAALEDTLDVGTLEPKLDVGSEEVIEPEPEPESDAPAPASRRRRGKRSAKPTPSRPAPPPPKAAAPEAEPDAKALLARAKAALRSGKHAEAHRLASKSRQAKRSSAALIVMATAACRMGNASKAKSAFAQLKVSERRGIRAECRNKGIRLGL